MNQIEEKDVLASENYACVRSFILRENSEFESERTRRPRGADYVVSIISGLRSVNRLCEFCLSGFELV